MNNNHRLFKSFFQGGFECSTHLRNDGKRLDVIASTKHDIYTFQDYSTLANHGIYTIRDGLRWHLIEKIPNYYDWSSFMPMLHAMQKSGIQVIWDLCHFGYPDDLNIWKPEFVDRFANFAAAVAQLIKNETDTIPFYSPINEISFWSWAGGDVAYFNPRSINRGFELKHQLVRASIAAIDAIRKIEPLARFIQAEPLINVISANNLYCEEAAACCEAQYQAWDMLTGNLWPGLGGSPDLLDIIGINFYPHNQKFLNGDIISYDNDLYKPFSEMIMQVHQRYNRPIFIAETGAEGEQRPQWLKYICDEVFACIQQNIAIHGICIYPITNYPNWVSDIICETGLLGEANPVFNGKRPIYMPLMSALYEEQARVTKMYCY